MKKPLFYLLSTLLLTAWTLASAETYYVDTRGSDRYSGTSTQRPFETITQALSKARPGDTIQLREGIYKEYVDSSAFRRSGRPGRPITIESYPGERAVIDGGKVSWSEDRSITNPTLFKVKEVDYYEIRNLTFRNSAGRSLYLEGDHHVVEGVVSYGNHSDGVYVSGNDNLLVGIISFDNYSEQNGGDSADGIKIAKGDGNVVRDCRLYRNSDDGLDIIYTTNTLVERCVAFENGRGRTGNGIGFKLSGQGIHNSGNVARYNVAYRNRQNNFDSNGGGGVTMLNNTSWDAGQRGFVLKASDKDTPNVGRNNISYGDPENSSGERDVLEHNSWNLGIDNPQFMSLDPDSPNFLALQKNSPAVDAGLRVGLPYGGRAPDLGALEAGKRLSDLLEFAQARR